MNSIQIAPIDATTFSVSIGGRTPTTHIVTVSPGYAKRLTADKVSVELLLEKSFEFLLERESNTSILRSFELSVIGQYFSEYERVIREKLDNL